MPYVPASGFADSITRLNVTMNHQQLLWLLPVLYLGVDENGIIKYVNKRWEELEYQPQDMLDKNYLEFVVEDDTINTSKEFEEVSVNEHYDTLFINRYRCKNGDIVELEWSSSYIHSMLMTFGMATIRKRIPKEEVCNG